MRTGEPSGYEHRAIRLRPLEADPEPLWVLHHGEACIIYDGQARKIRARNLRGSGLGVEFD